MMFHKKMLTYKPHTFRSMDRISATDPGKSTMNKLEILQTESLMNIEEKVTTAKSYISEMDNNKNSYRVNIQNVIDTITEDG